MEAAAELSCASKAGHKALPMWISCHSSVTVFVKSLLLSSANQHFAGILFYFGTCFTINSISNKITREKSVQVLDLIGLREDRAGSVFQGDCYFLGQFDCSLTFRGKEDKRCRDPPQPVLWARISQTLWDLLEALT